MELTTRSMRLPLGIRNPILCSCLQPFHSEKVASSQQRSCQAKKLLDNSLLKHSSGPLPVPSSFIRS
eukprot:6467386-Amphidinium_carterae.1